MTQGGELDVEAGSSDIPRSSAEGPQPPAPLGSLLDAPRGAGASVSSRVSWLRGPKVSSGASGHTSPSVLVFTTAFLYLQEVFEGLGVSKTDLSSDLKINP